MSDTQDPDPIIRRAQQRDPKAFDELVDLYSSRLFGLLYRMSGSRHEAEDLLQEVFLRVVRTIDLYKHQGRFESWLMRIAANLARDNIRRKSIRKKNIESAGPDGNDDRIDNQPAATPPPDRPMDTAEQVDRLNEALARLSDGEREVIMLRHFSDMSFNEIAHTLEIPLGTALARAHRGLARLRTLMAESQV